MEVSDFFSESKNECEVHRRARLCFASLCPSKENPFYCSVCTINHNKSQEPLVSIEEILLTHEQFPISNWPIDMSNESYQFLKYKQTSDLKDSMQKGIMMFYERLKLETNQILLESQKQQLLELEKIQIGSEEVIDLYNSLFKRNELVDNFKNKKVFSTENYKNILTSLSQTSKLDMEKLQNKINEKRQIEIEFRKFQEYKITDLLNSIISKINEYSPLNISDEIHNLQFEQYQFTPYSTQSQEVAKRNTMQSKIMELQKKINASEKKCALILEDNPCFEVNYDNSGNIKILNSNKKSGSLKPYYLNSIQQILSFKLKFSSLESLKNFKLMIYTGKERKQFQITEPLKHIEQYFQYQRQMSLQLKIIMNLKSKFIELQSDNFSEKQNIDFQQEQESEYGFSFQLEEDCSGFELSECKWEQ